MIIAHRGGQPENSLSAFTNCVLNEIDGIEFDVWKVGEEFLVIHDSEINNCLLEDLIDFKDIPTLKQTLDTIKDVSNNYNKKIPKLNVEIKGFDMNLGPWLKEYIQNTPEYSISDFIVTSFQHPEIEIFHQDFPEMEVGWVFSGLTMNLSQTLEIYPYISVVVVGRNAIDLKRIQNEKLSIELYNTKVWVYGEDKTRQIKEVKQLFDLGIDAFITDFPIECKKILIINK